HLFRRELLVVNENFRLAGAELARSVLGWIGGAAPGSLQSLSMPTEVLAYRRD
ncbi:LacI family transcriptional regulator, partial [Mesorhizobium sp. M2D.F.Ca.ET.178.01.1.1]